jgi:hypothetical protein
MLTYHNSNMVSRKQWLKHHDCAHFYCNEVDVGLYSNGQDCKLLTSVCAETVELDTMYMNLAHSVMQKFVSCGCCL